MYGPWSALAAGLGMGRLPGMIPPAAGARRQDDQWIEPPPPPPMPREAPPAQMAPGMPKNQQDQFWGVPQPRRR